MHKHCEYVNLIIISGLYSSYWHTSLILNVTVRIVIPTRPVQIELFKNKLHGVYHLIDSQILCASFFCIHFKMYEIRT